MQDSPLMSHLWHHLDGWVGDALADADSAKHGQSAAVLGEAAKSVAISVLRTRMSHPGSLRSLRRFLAALLPSRLDGQSEKGRLQQFLHLSPLLLLLCSSPLSLCFSVIAVIVREFRAHSKRAGLLLECRQKALEVHGKPVSGPSVIYRAAVVIS